MLRAAQRIVLFSRIRHQWPNTLFVRRLATIVPSIEPDPAVLQRTSIQLRDYQQECIQSVLSYFEKGGKRAGISLATGSGKTVDHP